MSDKPQKWDDELELPTKNYWPIPIDTDLSNYGDVADCSKTETCFTCYYRDVSIFSWHPEEEKTKAVFPPCQYSNFEDLAVYCMRYPKKIRKGLMDWCGEWREAKGPLARRGYDTMLATNEPL